MADYLILFAVEDEAYVRVVRNTTPKQLAALVDMVEFRHTPPLGAWTHELKADDDDASLIREEYEEARP